MEPNQHKTSPPKWLDKLLNWLVAPHLREEVLGDIHERYALRLQRLGERRAKRTYWREVLAYIRPSVIKRQLSSSAYRAYANPTHTDMLRNYFKIAFRNLSKHKTYSSINIGGLAVGMTVAMLIGLWIWDELSYDKYHPNYDRIAQVWNRSTYQGEFRAGGNSPIPLGNELRTAYPDDFEHVVMSSKNYDHILAYDDQKFTQRGSYLSPGAPEMLGLKMLRGTRAGLKEPASILLAESVAQALFGSADPVGKIVKIDNKHPVKVTGVYEDLPYNTEFHDLTFIAPWDLLVSSEENMKRLATNWQEYSFHILVQVAPNADLNAVSEKIKKVTMKHNPAETAVFKGETFLHPMSRWHLYTGWDKSGNLTGRIQFVWLFGIIGTFVLLLACINFMNLATARSEKRAKEVGIRKAIGSVRTQLMGQFFSESLLVVGIAFGLSLLLVQLVLPLFNEVADKRIAMPWTNPVFWLAGLGFTLLTGLVAGSYPAFYLSSFAPVKVLKGTFKVGRFAGVPRQVLVVVQFTVSITLIIGTSMVFKQIEHAKDRPIGYDRNGLVTIPITTPELAGRYNALRRELIQTGAVVDMSTSSSPSTDVDYHSSGFEWPGKAPNFKDKFGVVGVTHDFGKTVGWQFKQGRDFSRQFTSDSLGILLNETAVKYMGLADPVGKAIKYRDQTYQVLGVITDMVMDSPFDPIEPTVFLMSYSWAGVVNLKLNPELSATESLARLETVFRQFSPGSPFDFQFEDQAYAAKFAAEERIGRLASVFACLAILISCLGLFGLASFTAEQRTKEIGVRKVLGASVLNVWGLLSKEFVLLVGFAFLMATPLAYYFMAGWLQKYEYRTSLSWWVFALTGVGALAITLLTVSYQSIKAALLNPVRSLRAE